MLEVKRLVKLHSSKLRINYQLDAQIFFIYIISLYMFRAIMLIFRWSHYCIHGSIWYHHSLGVIMVAVQYTD